MIAVIALSAAGAALAWRASGPWSPGPAGLDPTTPSRATALTYLLLYGVGSIVLLIDGESRGAGPLLAGEAVALFGVGAIVGRRVLGATPSLPASNADGVRVGPMLALGVIGVLALATLIVQFGIPLIARDPLVSRAGFSGLVFDVFRWLVPPAALVALGLALTRGRRSDLWMAVIALVGVGGIEVLLASRALPFELAVEAILVAWWAEHRPSRRQWLGLAAAGLVAFVGIQLIRGGPAGGFGRIADAAGFATRRTVDRVLLIHPRTLEVIATTIPDEEPTSWGRRTFAGSRRCWANRRGRRSARGCSSGSSPASRWRSPRPESPARRGRTAGRPSWPSSWERSALPRSGWRGCSAGCPAAPPIGRLRRSSSSRWPEPTRRASTASS